MQTTKANAFPTSNPRRVRQASGLRRSWLGAGFMPLAELFEGRQTLSSLFSRAADFLSRPFSRKSSSGSNRNRRRAFFPIAERLEERAMMAVFTAGNLVVEQI